jgi:pimeloyl-ACP methyl ester carboxylesterase
MTGIAPQFFTAPDGVRLAWREMGKGRPLLLIHGFFSDAETNWIKYGTARQLAEAGFRCIMPDLRAHGSSDRPHDPAAYPPDVLADDQLTLLDALDLSEFDLAGYSLGARTAVRMLVLGATPRRAIISGMGYQGLSNTGARKAHFRNVLRNSGKHARGTPEWMADAFLKTTGGDPVALDLLLDSFVDTDDEALATLTLPVAIVCGAEDDDNGSAATLAETLPDGQLCTIPGNHMSAVTKPEIGQAFTTFLA